jgi:hypothetical protein
MRVYNYFLFRVYRFYTDKMKETQMPLFYTSAVSTVVVGFNLFTVYAILDYLDAVVMFSGKYLILIPAGVIWTITHFFFVKGKRFLEYGFKKGVKGGFLVISYIVLTAALFITVANLNRAKLEKQRLANPVKTEQIQKQKDEKPKSLEGRIRKWFEETF